MQQRTGVGCTTDGDADRVEGRGRGGPEAGGRLGASQVCGARQKHGRLLRGSDEDGVVRAETGETAREQDVDRDARLVVVLLVVVVVVVVVVRETERKRDSVHAGRRPRHHLYTEARLCAPARRRRNERERTEKFG